MARKRNDIPIGAVLFTYNGSDQDFDNFLKSVVHDYLAVGDLPINREVDFIEKVESSVA